MDQGCSEAVLEVFVKLYEKGYIYKGSRIINWCPVCQTSISDAEVEHDDRTDFSGILIIRWWASRDGLWRLPQPGLKPCWAIPR